MPLLKYFGLGGKLSCRGAVRRELVLIRADCPFAAFRPADQEDQQNEWVFDTSRWRLAPAENEPQGQKPSQGPIAVEWLDPVEAFAEMGRELSMTVCSRPAWPTRIRNRTLSRNARPASSGLEVSRAAKAFTAPNPFHKLPGKS
jgi:hypothetical protein